MADASVPIDLAIHGPVEVRGVGQSGQGVMVPLRCPHHGTVPVVLPFLTQTVSFLANEHGGARVECPLCKTMVPLDDGIYDFAWFVQGILARSGLTERQAEQALEALKARPNPSTADVLMSINPVLGLLYENALSGRSPRIWVGLIAITLGAFWATPEGINAGIALYDRIAYGPEHLRQNDPPSHRGSKKSEGQAAEPPDGQPGAAPQGDAHKGDNRLLPPAIDL